MPIVVEWLGNFLASGATLSRAVLSRLQVPTRIEGVVPPGWQPLSSEELDWGGRHIRREEALAPVRGLVTQHLGSTPAACVILEDAWATKKLPCGQGALPWVLVSASAGDELYWLSDRRHQADPDDILGAVTGRRFLAVLSNWRENPPDLCSAVPTSVIEDLALNAVAVITELFDGESYIVAHLAPQSRDPAPQ
jgi:hypothetical protein